MSIVYGILAVGLTIALSLVIYRVNRIFFFGHENTNIMDAARTTIIRMGVLHSLIIALVFSQTEQDRNDLWNNLANEASAVADLIFAAHDIDAAGADTVRDRGTDYAKATSGEEWRSLGDGEGLSRETWVLWGELRDAVFALKPGDERERVIKQHMLEEVFKIEDIRQRRALLIDNTASGIFWVAAIVGHVLIVLCFSVYRECREIYFLVGGFSAYTGIILYLIYDLGLPLHGLEALTPEPFFTLLRDVL